ncbi:uncharacterized protein TRIADDRAFT_54960 [Trichoplax adhaerens]|uniref:WH1 domain-containing protein n=1 Tax=Trichoplax adhaerens TaxID=10228 RepID=B3RTG8_TRIAD|nr:hypothetical protein TRIADDRAFT_54960 [Trichoplax adhaerens]EDV27225.1 hypothetical protein TRIADDRAFT_54960 [Trichoplax adhaerens]|eukprot:XP_002111221.1 hypothetical protein TRIADDRAFT_54960 [Trichoplax adhaerens]
MPPATNRNIPSKILTEEENRVIFDILASQKCTTLATTVVQVQLAQPNPSSWTKKCTGVLCLVKDYAVKSYFLRVYSPVGKTLLWEQEIYLNFQYKKSTEYFHTFQAHDCTAGFNFADTDEAASFYLTLTNKLKLKKEKNATVSRSKQKNKHQQPISNKPLDTYVRKDSAQVKSLNLSHNKRRPRDKGGKKLTKLDISQPTEFRHLKHVGWDENSKSLVEEVSEEWKDLYSSIGLTTADLHDENIMQMVHKVVEQRGGIEKANKEITLRRQRPSLSRPSLPPVHGSPAPCPPPPPCLPSLPGPIPIPIPASLPPYSSSRSPSPPLPSPPPLPVPPVSEPRESLFDQIHRGIELRKVHNTEEMKKKAPPLAEESSIITALDKELARMNPRVQRSDSESSDGSDWDDMD